MALTIQRQLALFQCLEVPFFDQQGILYADGALTTLHDVTGSTRSTQKLIQNHLTNYIYVDPTGLQVVLEGLLDDWIALGEDTTRIEGGSIGNITGIVNDIREERSEVQKKILVMVPYYRAHEQMQRGITSIPIIR